MTDRQTALLAVAVATGALLAVPVPWWALVGAVGMAVARRHPALVCLVGGLLACTLAHRAWAGTEPVRPAPVHGWVTLLSDPVDVGGAVRAEVRVEGRRVEAWSWGGSAAGRLRSRLAGERVHVTGRLAPPDESVRERLARRHVVGRLEVDRVHAWGRGDPVSAAANALRRLLVDGAVSLAPAQRALFTGVVLGDDREQAPDLADDFRAAGLTHLLAVSGQNVAFVLAVASPLLRRCSWPLRLPLTLAVLAFFALVVRFEPSVLRASAMAGLATVAAGIGRPAASRRVLALAVAAVLLVDPLLVHSVAFQLSVGASAGIILVSEPLARRLWGPPWLARPVAVTLAAQIGTTPVLLAVFGGMPAVTVPANVLAVPAAGPLMTWGLSAGLVAGLARRAGAAGLAGVLHLPTAFLVDWIAGVARVASGLGGGQLDPGAVAVLALLASAVVAARLLGSRRRLRRVVALAATMGVVLVVVGTAPRLPDVAAGVELPGGAELWRAPGPDGRTATVLVLTRPRPERLLESCRLWGVRRVDVLVSPTGGVRSAEAVAPLRRRLRPRLVLVPRGHDVPGGETPPAHRELLVGGLVLQVGATHPTLQVDVRLAAAAPTESARPASG